VIEKQLVRCTQCNTLTLFSPMDQIPEYQQKRGKWKIQDRDDRASFMQNHRGHQLEELHVIEDSFISHQAYVEPVKTSYFEATNGKQRFVVKKFRKSIFDSQCYELIAGKLRLTPTELRIDSSAIQKELERVFSPSPLSSKKVGYFVKQLEATVSNLSPGDLRRVPFASHNPSVWSCYLDEWVLEKVLNSSSKFLTEEEIRCLDEFVRKNLEDNLFMAVTKVEFQIETRVVDKESEIPDR
jgi:hypothetical protein